MEINMPPLDKAKGRGTVGWNMETNGNLTGEKIVHLTVERVVHITVGRRIESARYDRE